MNPLSRFASAVGLSSTPPAPAMPPAGIYPPESLAATGQAVWEGDEGLEAPPPSDFAGSAPRAISSPSGDLSGEQPGKPLSAVEAALLTAYDAGARDARGVPPEPIGALGKPDLWPELLSRLGDLPAEFKAACQEYRALSRSLDGYTTAGRAAFVRAAFVKLNHVTTVEDFHRVAGEIAAVGDDTQRAQFEQASAHFLQAKYAELFPPLLFELEAVSAGVLQDLRAEALAREAEAERVSLEMTGTRLTGRPLTAKVNALEATLKRLLSQSREEGDCAAREVPGLYFEQLFA